MSDAAQDLIHGYLDDTLTDHQQDELSHWIKTAPQNALQFAETVLLHDCLRTEMVAGEVLQIHAQVTARSMKPERRWGARLVAISTALCLTLVVALILWQPVSSPVLAASSELQRIIQANDSSLVRTYVVTALDNELERKVPPLPGRGAKPSVDGAVLHVRGPDEYVLIRYFADGTEFINGSNGTTAWSIPPRGRVRVSSDPTRFRGAVPGQQHAIPFIDIRNSLHRIQESYTLDLSTESSPEGWRQMTATRKSSAAGGPKHVTLWYDAESGAIHEMLLERLPQGRGGPRNVSLQLTAERDLGSAFFEHGSHHNANREVIEE